MTRSQGLGECTEGLGRVIEGLELVKTGQRGVQRGGGDISQVAVRFSLTSRKELITLYSLLIIV